jgi:hypothetical protein
MNSFILSIVPDENNKTTGCYKCDDFIMSGTSKYSRTGGFYCNYCYENIKGALSAKNIDKILFISQMNIDCDVQSVLKSVFAQLF